MQEWITECVLLNSGDLLGRLAEEEFGLVHNGLDWWKKGDLLLLSDSIFRDPRLLLGTFALVLALMRSDPISLDDTHESFIYSLCSRLLPTTPCGT